MKLWFSFFILISSQAFGISLPGFGWGLIDNAGPECTKLLSGPAYKTYPKVLTLDTNELSFLLEKHNVELPQVAPSVFMSDRARAAKRNLPNVFPALINRRLLFRVSERDGHNSYYVGAIRGITPSPDGRDSSITLTIENPDYHQQDRTEEVIISGSSITQLRGLSDRHVVRDVKEIELQSIRGFRREPSEILGLRVQVGDKSGILVAYAVPRRGVIQHLLQESYNKFTWVDALETVENEVKAKALLVPEPW